MASEPSGHITIEDEFLRNLFYLFSDQAVIADKWSKQGVNVGKNVPLPLGFLKIPHSGTGDI